VAIAGRTRAVLPPSVLPLIRETAGAFREHELFVFASALAFRVLVSLVPLTLLGFALLGLLGRDDLWREELGPQLKDRVTPAVYRAIDDTVERIFHSQTWALFVFAIAFALWNLARAMRVVMKAMNAIHGVRERRSPRRLIATDVVLAVVVLLSFVGSFSLVVLLPRLAHGGAASTVLKLVAWLAAAVVIALTLAILVRYAPAERPEPRWASAGSLVVVATWIMTTAIFGWWTGSVANYKSAVGTLAAFLVLTTYLLVSTTIFLVGAQIDELARKRRS
jgi:membrane protein